MMRIGIVGVGAISGIYLKNITNMFQEIEVIGVCDLIRERAEKAVEEYNIPKLYEDMHELFADPEVDLVLNLTRPYEHFDVTMGALKAGKNVYSEKPLGATFEEGLELVKYAKEHNLLIGGAPDTFLGAGIQTSKKLIDDGFIGDVVGASAYMVCRGHETWHPDPEFYYKFGGGPMLDMGPYYITALINLLGPVKSVAGMSKITFPQRTITSAPHYGDIIDVDVPTYITGLMQFRSGVIGTIFTTFDAYVAEVPRIEIYGSKGTLSVPDPNTFGGPVRLYRAAGPKPLKGDPALIKPEPPKFQEIPLLFDYPDTSRALGLADMAKAIETGRARRASSDVTLHVIEVLTSFNKSSAEHRFVDMTTTMEPAAPMVQGLMAGVLD